MGMFPGLLAGGGNSFLDITYADSCLHQSLDHTVTGYV